MTDTPTPPLGRYSFRNRPHDCSAAVRILYANAQQLDDDDLRDLHLLVGSLRAARAKLGANLSKSAPNP